MKIVVKDEEGKTYTVEELIEKEAEKPAEEPKKDEVPAALSDDEVASLKKLAACADKLVALLDVEKDEHEEQPDVTDEEDDGEKDEDEELKDEVIETDKMRKDSKSSFGSIEKKKAAKVDDSLEDDVSAAWAKRYSNGGNKE